MSDGAMRQAEAVTPDPVTASAAAILRHIRTLAFSSEELAAAEAETAAALSRRQGQARSLGALMADWAAADDPRQTPAGGASG